MSRGCPQGSALGPLLWNVFQNDLSYCLTANLSMYADDHQIYHAGADQAAVTSQLKDSANLATTWYDSNLLAGNLKKYQVLNLGFTQNDSNICVNDVVIDTKDNIILLGVVLDSKLNFSEHVISICKKASQRIGVLMRLRNLIPMKSKLILFKSAILPFLTYCHLVWHFCKASDTRKLERLQESILGDPGADSGGQGKSKRAEKYGTKKSKERREEPLGTMSYQTSSNGRRRSGF